MMVFMAWLNEFVVIKIVIILIFVVIIVTRSLNSVVITFFVLFHRMLVECNITFSSWDKDITIFFLEIIIII